MRLCRGRLTRREKVFGQGRAVPLDRNAKVRVWTAALAHTARLRQRGQHRGPLSRATLDVLRALLWGFHNQHTGRCFPSYERIAEAANVHRASVARAIDALETAGILTWENRLVRVRVAVAGLFGPTSIIVPQRTSNAYRFTDPHPLAMPPAPKSQNSTGTRNQGIFIEQAESKLPFLDPNNRLHAALMRLGAAIERNPVPQAGA